MGTIYANGYDVKQDYAAAAKYYTRGCNGGDGESCYLLGLAYKNGLGVGQNSDLATGLFKKACDNGSEDGCAQLRKTRRR